MAPEGPHLTESYWQAMITEGGSVSFLQVYDRSEVAHAPLSICIPKHTGTTLIGLIRLKKERA